MQELEKYIRGGLDLFVVEVGEEDVMEGFPERQFRMLSEGKDTGKRAERTRKEKQKEGARESVLKKEVKEWICTLQKKNPNCNVEKKL